MRFNTKIGLETLGWTFVCLTYLACEQPSMIHMDERLQPYVATFMAEAAERNILVPDHQLMGTITNIENATGQCEQGQPKMLRIDADFWQSSTHLQREFLIFHELGHCILNRRHLDSRHPDGTCRSIMHSNNLACTNAYAHATRSDYLDELFTLDTSTP